MEAKKIIKKLFISSIIGINNIRNYYRICSNIKYKMANTHNTIIYILGINYLYDGFSF